MDMREIDLDEFKMMLDAGCTILPVYVQEGRIYIDADTHDSLEY